MDLSSISNFSNQQANLFKTNNNTNKGGKTNKTIGQKNSSPASKITLAKKGQAGYMKEMDADNDRKVTLEEFNQYCEENGLSSEDKMKLLTCMQVSQMNEKISEDNKKTQEEEEKKEKTEEKSSSKNDAKSIYAKKGDDKYNQEMDANDNGTITYAEYIDYINKKGETSQIENSSEVQNTDKSTTSTEEKTVQEDDSEIYEPETIEPEVQSTVEFYV